MLFTDTENFFRAGAASLDMPAPQGQPEAGGTIRDMSAPQGQSDSLGPGIRNKRIERA